MSCSMADMHSYQILWPMFSINAVTSDLLSARAFKETANNRSDCLSDGTKNIFMSRFQRTLKDTRVAPLPRSSLSVKNTNLNFL